MAAAAILNLLFLSILVKRSISGGSRLHHCNISFIYGTKFGLCIKTEIAHLTKMDKNNKFKMVAAAILNFICRSHSYTIAHILTKFGKCITLEVLHARMPKY